jgi:hypothetical protein
LDSQNPLKKLSFFEKIRLSLSTKLEMIRKFYLLLFSIMKSDPWVRDSGRGAGTAPRFAEPQGGNLSMRRAGPQASRLSLRNRLDSGRETEIPTGASTNRAAVPAPNPGCFF